MSYPMTCVGGFAMPLATGKFEIVGVNATVDNVAAASQLAIFDRSAELIGVGDIYAVKPLIIDLKGYAASDTNLFYEFSEPIKVRNGISIAADNIKAGSICVYRR